MPIPSRRQTDYNMITIECVSQNIEKSALLEAAERLKLERFCKTLEVNYTKAEEYGCESRGGRLDVRAPQKHYVFRAMALFAARGGAEFSVTETRAFRRHGIMLDCSRNAVLTADCVKKYILLSALMGYNTVQLYTEDTYEICGEPYFGYLRGKYSRADLKAFDEYASRFGIELIPCIQTLAHLNGIFRWKPYREIHDLDDVLLVGEEKTYELIDKMFQTVSECFTSRTVNIGMDEAFRLGLGNYAAKHGVPEDRMKVMLRHLKRVAVIAQKYGFQCVMWSDMFYRLVFHSYYSEDHPPVSDEYAQEIPENVELIYWDYYSTNSARYDAVIDQHKVFRRNIWFAGCAWTWLGFLPYNRFSIDAARASIESCKKNGVRDSFLTMWGDNGGECSVFAVLPSLVCAAEFAYGNTEPTSAENLFRAVAGAEMDSFLLLEKADKVGNYACAEFSNPTKYLLYSDCFAGIYDNMINADDAEQFLKIAAELKEHEKGEWAYIFRYVRALCEVMSLKYAIGIRTRALYRARDKKGLKKLANTEYKPLISALNEFYGAFRQAWRREKKEHGFEVHDIRLGGLIRRVENCRSMLLEYAAGKRDAIAQLDEDILDACGEGTEAQKQCVYENNFVQSASVNFI